MPKEATPPPIELTDEEAAGVLAAVESGELLPCGGHAWPGPRNRTTPVVVVRRDGERDRQLSLRPILWRLAHGEAPGRPVFSMHAPPCCEHLTLNRAQANKVIEKVETPETPRAGPAVDQSQEGHGQHAGEPQSVAHETQEAAVPALSAAEPPTSPVEPMSADEAQGRPVRGFPASDRRSVGAHPWQLAERRTAPPARRTVAVLAAVAAAGLLWPAGCRALARTGDRPPGTPVTATTGPTTTPPPNAGPPPAPEAASTTAWTQATMPEPCTPAHCPTLED